MGIQLIARPDTEVDAGLFNLPPDFDSDRFASTWKAAGSDVEKAQMRQGIVGTRFTADSWEVYKGKDKQIVRRSSSKGDYVLMFRPREIQNAVHALYGNVGLERMTAQKQGYATDGSKPTGILTEEELSRSTREPAMDSGEVVLNKVPGGLPGKVETAALKTAD